jgi:hypothetical protein
MCKVFMERNDEMFCGMEWEIMIGFRVMLNASWADSAGRKRVNDLLWL